MSAVGSHAPVFRRGETVGVNFGRVPVFREANARAAVFSSFPESHEFCPAEGGLVQGCVHLVAGAGETVTFVVLHLLGEGIHFSRLVVADADFGPEAQSRRSKSTVAVYFSSTSTLLMLSEVKAFEVEPRPTPTKPFRMTGSNLRAMLMMAFIFALCASISGVFTSFREKILALAMFSLLKMHVVMLPTDFLTLPKR